MFAEEKEESFKLRTKEKVIVFIVKYWYLNYSLSPSISSVIPSDFNFMMYFLYNWERSSSWSVFFGILWTRGGVSKSSEDGRAGMIMRPPSIG